MTLQLPHSTPAFYAPGPGVIHEAGLERKEEGRPKKAKEAERGL